VESRIRRALEDLQVAMKRQDSLSNAKSLESLKALSAAVWKPLEGSVKDAKVVVLSPDGQLSLIPFAALLDQQDHPLLERVLLAYVSSGRELIGSDTAMTQPASDLLLVANPDFDYKARETGSQTVALRSRDFRGSFTSLPGTERESKEVPPLVIEKNGQKQVLVGGQATESAVKASRSPRILHLATHGFFLTDEDIDLSQNMQRAFLERDLAVKPRASTKRYENPLVRSGLAFAGANHATQTTEGDDGILTALEITGMDLSGTELVVLSACDTGVGEVRNGEGVFGLRRAFALAGAKNLLMSLWPVSDEITANQMKAFYRNLQTVPPAEALRNAQLETIKELKERFDGVAPAGLWAPFILQGAGAWASK
jgi:CHAT domain-containing protein